MATAVATEQKFITLVREFHTVFGHAVKDGWVSDDFLSDVKTRVLRVKLIDEEVGELKDSYAIHEDFIEIIDALADITYVAVGASLVHGVKITPRIEDMPLVSHQTRDIDFEAGVDVCLEFAELAVRFSFAKTDAAVRESLENLVSACYRVAAGYGVDLQEVVDEVHRSNMTKLGEDGLPLYNESGKVIKGPNYEVPQIEAVLDRQLAREQAVAAK